MAVVWNSRSRYQIALEEKEENQTEKEKWSLEKDVLQKNSNKFKLSRCQQKWL